MRTDRVAVAANGLVGLSVCAGGWTVLAYAAIMAGSPRGPAGARLSDWLLAIGPGAVVVAAAAAVYALAGPNRRLVARRVVVSVLCCAVPLFPVVWDFLSTL